MMISFLLGLARCSRRCEMMRKHNEVKVFSFMVVSIGKYSPLLIKLKV